MSLPTTINEKSASGDTIIDIPSTGDFTMILSCLTTGQTLSTAEVTALVEILTTNSLDPRESLAIIHAIVTNVSVAELLTIDQLDKLYTINKLSMFAVKNDFLKFENGLLERGLRFYRLVMVIILIMVMTLMVELLMIGRKEGKW